MNTPVRPELPAGEAAAYDPAFEAIRSQILKLDSLQGETPDWGEIVERGTELLRSKSKDLTVAGYLALSLFRREGYPGLHCGLTVFEALLSTWWEDLFPEKKRMRGRIAAVSWMNERLAAAVTRTPPGAAEAEAVASCVDGLKRVADLVGEKFGAEAPSLGDLRRSLEDAARSAAPPPAPARPAASAPAQPAAATGAIDSVDAANRALRGAALDVRRAVEFLVRNDPSSAGPYFASRGIAWSQIRELPQDKEGTTMLGSPDAAVMASWERMWTQHEWKALLEDTEWRVTTSPFHLDLNFYVAAALAGLGFEAARNAVVDLCLAFTRRLPRMLELKYQDGRPFASEATRAWLAAESAARSAAGSASREAPAGEAGEGDRLGHAAAKARALAARGDLAGAIGLLSQGSAAAVRSRERFRWMLETAAVCQDAGRDALAGALLEALDEKIERHGLEEWEPELALKVLRALYGCEKKLGQNGQRDARESVQRLDRLYARLSRLDPEAALTLESKR